VTVTAESQLLLEGEAGEGLDERGAVSIQNMYRNALFTKKQAKVHKYTITNGGKKYKKYLITKKFREDDEGKKRRIPAKEKEALNTKLMGFYQAQLSAK